MALKYIIPSEINNHPQNMAFNMDIMPFVDIAYMIPGNIAKTTLCD